MITKLQIDNFKSLKGISVEFGAINFIVGPNASGKSNLTEAIDFLSHTVREDLGYAVAEKGGFYNICHRRQRRVRGGISFLIEGNVINRNIAFNFGLSFHLKTDAEGIRAGFYVAAEEVFMAKRGSGGVSSEAMLKITRKGDRYEVIIPSSNSDQMVSGDSDEFAQNCEIVKRLLDQPGLAPAKQHLLISGFFKEFWPLSVVTDEVQGLRAFQLNPRTARDPSAPSVEGNLGRRGENLAAALDRMRTNDEASFELLRSWLRDVVPTFESIVPAYTETRQLGLFFEEEGAGSRWFSEDVSDGTIMSVALFFALLDKRHRTIIIEEPETSLHPWILKRFLERCREQSSRCQIIITTHSPLAVAQARPEELFLISRTNGVTSIVKALEAETELSEIIREGCLDLGQYWLSGGIGAVPDVPTLKAGELFANNVKDEE